MKEKNTTEREDENKKIEADKNLINVVRMKDCKNHFLHKGCLNNMCKNSTSLKCPICNKIYGIMEGEFLENSHMYRKEISSSCDGHHNYGSIEITYSIPNGKTKDGKYYHGTTRKAYLPNNDEGNEIYGLLEKAFYRGLLFTVGISITSGAKNTVTWNGVHHKTSLYGGVAAHGYPDSTYLTRVKEELKAKGVYPGGP